MSGAGNTGNNDTKNAAVNSGTERAKSRRSSVSVARNPATTKKIKPTKASAAAELRFNDLSMPAYRQPRGTASANGPKCGRINMLCGEISIGPKMKKSLIGT